MHTKRQAANVHATKIKSAATCATRNPRPKENYALVIHIKTKTDAARRVFTLVPSLATIVWLASRHSKRGVARMEIPHVVILTKTRAATSAAAKVPPSRTLMLDSMP
jgi:hypothetical protein